MKRRGTVLIVTIWVMLVLAGLALVFGHQARVDLLAVRRSQSACEAEAVLHGAVAYVLQGIAEAGVDVARLSELPAEAVPLGAGRFWILRDDPEDDRAWAFGIAHEAGKLDLDTTPAAVLSRLPGMTAESAAAIADWRDADDEVTPGGAERETYLLRPRPYLCKNAPFESCEELFLVEGMTREGLLGEDRNRNGVLDEGENDAQESEPPDNRDGRLDLGALAHVTLGLRAPNTDAQGRSRVNVNAPDTGALSAVLREAVAPARFFGLMDRVRAGQPYRNPIDFFFRTGLTRDEFKAVADRLTTAPGAVLQGRVDLTRAARAVLKALGDLDDAQADALVARRASADPGAWDWIIDALPQAKAVALGDLMGPAGRQFSADIVAVAGDGRAFRRARVSIDAHETYDGTPVLRQRRDLTALGWPLDPALLEELRRGGEAGR